MLADRLYTEHGLDSVSQIISQQSPLWIIQEQISLAADLISKTCSDEHHRKLVEQAGLYNIFAAKLASFIVATGCSLAGSSRCRAVTISPAPEKAELAPILGAIIAILDKSKARWMRFLAAPAFEEVFPGTYPEGLANFSSLKSSTNKIESLIPHLQSSNRTLSDTSNFHALSAIGTPLQPSLRVYGLPTESADGAEVHESPLIPWLVYMARADVGVLARLMALQAVTHLHCCDLTHKHREAEFAIILVPLLVTMLDKGQRQSVNSLSSIQNDSTSDQRLVEERAPAVLAALTVDSPELQRAAIEAGSIKKLSLILRKSFDSLPPHSTTSLWSPELPNSGEMETTEEFRLGSPGLSPVAYHITLVRESVLKALAAIASLNDEYRKSIIENAVVPFVIQSLKPYDSQSLASQVRAPADDSKGSTAVTENTKEVILAACALARGLSRSVSTLRTSLMDAGLAAPLFTLLKHQDVQIQIAATAVVCNIVLNFSPMREVSTMPLMYLRITKANRVYRPSLKLVS